MRKSLIILSILSLAFTANAQTSLSFYNLGNATFNNSHYNPSFIPEGKVFFGLPAMSGIHFHYNNRLSYSEMIKTNPETGNPKIELPLAFKNMGRNNLIGTQVGISLFHFGVRNENGMAFSIFANERIESDIFLNKKLMKFAIRGNGTVIDQKIEAYKSRLQVSHFREYGIGVALPSPSVNMVVGARLKYLQGFINYSTPGSNKTHITTDGINYAIEGKIEDAMLRTAGQRVAKGNTGDYSYFGFNGNNGFAVDLGFNWEMDKYNAVSVSLTDLGFISWKDDTKNYFLTDTTFYYVGDSLRKNSDVEKSARTFINDVFGLKRESGESYSTGIGPKLYASWTYHTPIRGGDVVTSFGSRYIQRNIRSMFGVGYRQRAGNFLVVTGNLTKLPQQFFNLGTSLAIKGGPAQMYVAVDQLYNFDATKFQAIDFRFGINFILGARDSELKSNSSTTTFAKGGQTKNKPRKGNYSQFQSFMGKEVEVKGHDGIYSIIPKQHRRKKEEYMQNPPD